MARLVPWILWLGLIGAAWVAPPTRDDVGPWVWKLLTWDVSGENLVLVALFNLMGVWPWAMASLLVDELLPAEHPASWRDRVPALPFVVLANVLGMFVLGVYLVLRRPDRPPARRRAWLAWLGSTPFRAVLALVATGLVAWGLGRGDVAEFLAICGREGFAWTMSFDFLAFSGAAVWLAATRRRVG